MGTVEFIRDLIWLPKFKFELLKLWFFLNSNSRRLVFSIIKFVFMLYMGKNVNQLHSNLISANSLGWIRNWSAGWRQTFRVWSHSSPGLFLQSSVEAQRSIKMQKYNFGRFKNTNNKDLTEWSHSSAEKRTFFRLNIIFFAKTTELMSSGQWLWIIFSNLHAGGECFF